MKYREASKKLKTLGCEELPRRGAGHTAFGIIQRMERSLHYLIGGKGFETRYTEGGHSSIRVGLARVFEYEISEIKDPEENSEFCFEMCQSKRVGEEDWVVGGEEVSDIIVLQGI